MKLKNENLEGWLERAPNHKYPQKKKIDHFTDYAKLKKYLKENVHNQVTSGGNLSDPTVLLNDHGIDHIETVISRASFLVSNEKCDLTPYEVYVLLCCIQLHDVGNIFGRYQHELKIDEIMIQAENICGTDTIESIRIKKIAETHGGKLSNGSKDKIDQLEESENTFYGPFRPRLLASILRFADELADDKNRAFGKLLLLGKIPKQSEVFHAYALCLDSVHVSHQDKAIKLSFHIPKEFLIKKFGKLNEEIYLLDEIYDRLLKMHYERIYCSRYFKNWIDIDKITVTINFHGKSLTHVYPRISFELSEKGYPRPINDIFELCSELILGENKINGEFVKSKVESHEKPI